MEYVIYKIRNKINNKCYVGSTVNINRRWRQHCSDKSSCTYLKRAIKNYGKENFEISILETTIHENMLPSLECKYILSENTLVPNGYNLILETEHGRNICQDSRDKMSKSFQGLLKANKSSSKFLGVRYQHGKFEARLTNKKITNSARFTNEIDAAEAYDKCAIYIYGLRAKINFPDKLEKYCQEDLFYFYKNTFNITKTFSSRYRNISFHKLSGKWRVYYYNNKKQIQIPGLFDSEDEAQNARLEYFKKNRNI